MRAQIAGRKRGYDLSELRARQITADDFRECDFILAMDWENLTAMQQICPPMYKHKLALLMRYASEYDTAVVPDPYYGGNEGFNTVLDYCEDAAKDFWKSSKNVLQCTFPAHPFKPEMTAA